MSSADWDLIRFELPEGKTPLGRNILVFRNGVMIPGLTAVKLETDVNSAIKVTMTQYVRLEGPATIEEAIQALEEREAIWDEEALGNALLAVFAMNHIDTSQVVSFDALAGAVLRAWKGETDAEQQ